MTNAMSYIHFLAENRDHQGGSSPIENIQFVHQGTKIPYVLSCKYTRANFLNNRGLNLGTV